MMMRCPPPLRGTHSSLVSRLSSLSSLSRAISISHLDSKRSTFCLIIAAVAFAFEVLVAKAVVTHVTV